MMFASEVIEKITMINTLVPQENLIVGGQPTADDLRMMKLMGISQVINLRPSTEPIDFDEVSLLKELGMQYHLIPVTTITTFTKAAALRLTEILKLHEPTLLHCASGNRVGALIALKGFWCNALTAQESLEQGLQAGLTKLAPQVREILGL